MTAGPGWCWCRATTPTAGCARRSHRAERANALAPRELLVARYVGMGLRNREIAERMGVTEGTVKVYLHNLFAKTGMSNAHRTGAADRAPVAALNASGRPLTFDNLRHDTPRL